MASQTDRFKLPNRDDSLQQRIRKATDPVGLPYGVFGIAGNPYIGKVFDKEGNAKPRIPTRKQGLFFSNKYNNVFEGFYGGAAGGAKSDAILMAALQFVMVPSYSALILRQNFAQLNKRGALISRSHEWLGNTDAVWNGSEKKWTFPSGATLEFGHLENGMKSALNFSGSNYHFIAIDEVTDIGEDVYTFLMSRCRSLESEDYIPLRFRSASNPIGPGLGWVKRRFVIPVKDRTKGSIFRVFNEELGETEDRFFIPANLRDNPYLNVAQYTRQLSRLDTVTRARLLKGDWDVQQSGSVFDTSYLQTITRSELPDRLKRVRYWDLAGTDEKDNPSSSNTVGLLYGVDSITGYDYVIDVVKFKRNPTDVERTLIDVANKDGRNVEIHIEQEPGQSGKAQIHNFQNILHSHTVRGDLPGKRGSKEVRAKPIANKIGRKTVFVVEADWNEDFYSDLAGFPSKQAQDCVDALSGAHAVSRKKDTVQSTNRMTGARNTGKPTIMFRGKRIS